MKSQIGFILSAAMVMGYIPSAMAAGTAVEVRDAKVREVTPEAKAAAERRSLDPKSTASKGLMNAETREALKKELKGKETPKDLSASKELQDLIKESGIDATKIDMAELVGISGIANKLGLETPAKKAMIENIAREAAETQVTPERLAEKEQLFMEYATDPVALEKYSENIAQPANQLNKSRGVQIKEAITKAWKRFTRNESREVMKSGDTQGAVERKKELKQAEKDCAGA